MQRNPPTPKHAALLAGCSLLTTSVGFPSPRGVKQREKIFPQGSWGCLQADVQGLGVWSAACEQAGTPRGLEVMQEECPMGQCNPFKTSPLFIPAPQSSQGVILA